MIKNRLKVIEFRARFMNRNIALVSGFILLLQANPVTAFPQQQIIKSFAQSCQEKASVSPSRRLTINILLKEAGTNDCNIAERQLKSIRKLHLTYKKISDLDPLASLTNLESLYLYQNEIVKIDSLASESILTISFLLSLRVFKLVKPASGLISTILLLWRLRSFKLVKLASESILTISF